jgi:ubiquinone/menaquinone biosynthesis C-methylase UbiE
MQLNPLDRDIHRSRYDHAEEGGEHAPSADGGTTDFTSVTSSRAYLTMERAVSYHMQFELVLDAMSMIGRNKLEILEVGGSNNITRSNLQNYFCVNRLEHRVKSLDLDETSHPDLVGDIRQLPLEDDSVDIAICCEVLEHLPFEDAEVAFRELARVTKGFVVLSLPHASLFLSVSLVMSRIRPRYFLFSFLDPFFMNLKESNRPFRHYWEIGYRGYGKRRIRRSLADCGLEICTEFRNPLLPAHHYFLLSSRG